jgi:hypothetical protein
MHCERIEQAPCLERWPEAGRIVDLMAGDLHRIIVYPSLGFPIRRGDPKDVVAALERPVSAEFGKHLVAGYPLRGDAPGASGRGMMRAIGPEGATGA